MAGTEPLDPDVAQLKRRADGMELALDTAIGQFERSARRVNEFAIGLVSWRQQVQAHMDADEAALAAIKSDLTAIKTRLEDLHEKLIAETRSRG